VGGEPSAEIMQAVVIVVPNKGSQKVGGSLFLPDKSCFCLFAMRLHIGDWAMGPGTTKSPKGWKF